jgi:uncharacterized coiled-coil DUF342 family protein
MPDISNSINWWTIVAGIGTAVSTTIFGIWKIMDGQVRHWKELHDAKVAELGAKAAELAAKAAELENVRREPNEYARIYIARFEQAVSDQIAKLVESVQKLKADLLEKDETIRGLMTEAKDQEERVTYYQEKKESLERKIAAYEQIIARLSDRRLLARQVYMAFESDTFNVGLLEAQTESEIASRMRDIDATSFSATSRAAKVAAQKSAVAKSARAHQELAEKAAAEQKMKNRLKLSMKEELPTENSINSFGQSKRD